MTELEAFVSAELQELNCPGCSFAFLRDGELVHSAGFGLANVEHEIAARADTVYEIASITKLFTATAVMQLVQSGQIDLSAPLADYLDDLPAAWHAVALHHILSHQSGIKSYTAVDAYWKSTRLDISQPEIIDLVRDLPLQFQPGERHGYDNTGFYLLGYLIERVSGQSYGDYLSKHIFAPLGMCDTRVNNPYAPVARRASGYTTKDGQLRNKAYYSPSGTFSAGVLLSSVNDLAKFAASLYGDVLLDEQYRVMMWQERVSAEKNELANHYRMGLGWYLVDWKDGRRFAGHNGSIVGFASAFAHFLNDRTTVICLCNSDKVEAPHQLGFKISEKLA